MTTQTLSRRGIMSKAWSEKTKSMNVQDYKKKEETFASRNVNGTGSASANHMFAKAIFRMGIPVSPRNIFPSNIQGLPTWYEIRVTRDGYVARSGRVDLMVAMNAETYQKDVREVSAGGYLIYDSTWPRSTVLKREDITILGVPLAKICNENFVGVRNRILMKNIMYAGVLAALLADLSAPMLVGVASDLTLAPVWVGLGVDELDRGGDRGARGLDPGGGDHHLVQKRRVRGGPLLGRRGKRAGEEEGGRGEAGATVEVRDANGSPLPNVSVSMKLLTLTGGVTMEGGTADVVRASDAQGRVTLGLNAGIDYAPVRQALFKVAMVNARMPRWHIATLDDPATGERVDSGCAMPLPTCTCADHRRWSNRSRAG